MIQPHDDLTGTAKMHGEEPGNELEITYVVYLIDDNGEEYFVNQENELIPVSTSVDQQLLILKNLFQISAQLTRLRKIYLSNCRLFALEYGEFLERKRQIGSATGV